MRSRLVPALSALVVALLAAACGSVSSPLPTTVVITATAALQLVAATPNPSAIARPQQLSTYTVRSGDTLSAIAATLGTSLQALIDANPSISPNVLQVGQVLTQPGAVAQVAAPTPRVPPVSTPGTAGAPVPLYLLPSLTPSAPSRSSPTPRPTPISVDSPIPTQAPKSVLPPVPAQIPASTFVPPAPPSPPSAPAVETPSGPFIPYAGNGRGPTQCRDGTVSHSSGCGTCSGHGGEAP